ncbi:hypothetical protein CRUP_003136, partial [Coryphaenoides rupestris]
MRMRKRGKTRAGPRARHLEWRPRGTSQVNRPPAPAGTAAGRRSRRRAVRRVEHGARLLEPRGLVNGRPAPLRCAPGRDLSQRRPPPREPSAELEDALKK